LPAETPPGFAAAPVIDELGTTPTPPAPLPAAAARGLHFFWWLAAAVLGLDQVTKALIRAHLQQFDSVTIIPNLLDFTHVENNGVAFGYFNDTALPFKGGLTSALAIIALIGIGLYARHIRREELMARIGLSLILGGAVGNLIDRLRVGYVDDFVDVYVRGWHFWAFNVADASITIGAILVFLDLLLVARHASDPV
jgi:signal peptidase II